MSDFDGGLMVARAIALLSLAPLLLLTRHLSKWLVKDWREAVVEWRKLMERRHRP